MQTSLRVLALFTILALASFGYGSVVQQAQNTLVEIVEHVEDLRTVV